MSTVLSGRLLALVCGLPSPKREHRLLMALQAYVDDSVAAGEVLVLAGYISTAERWAAFSNEWQVLLDMRPRMAKFHMTEVDRNSDLQMERVRFFYRAIEEHAIAATAVAIDLKQLAASKFDASVPKAARSPYVMAYKAILDVTLQHQREIDGLDRPIDFIFDNRSEKKIVQAAYQSYGDQASDEDRRLIGRTPMFEDDAEFLPLQAADFFAWWARRHWEEHRTISSAIELPVKRFAKMVPTIYLDVAGDDLRLAVDDMNEHYRAIAAERLSKPREVRVGFSIDLSGDDPDPKET